jgi:hypothetical protein
MIQPQQLYLNVSRNMIEHVVNQQYEKGFLLIQSVDLAANKVLLTFQKSDLPSMKCQDRIVKVLKEDPM